MIKKEIKNNYKSLIIWASVLTSLFLIVFILYPAIIDNLDPKLMNDYIAVLPKEMLKIMNFDIVDIMTAFGWFKSEGFIMLILIGGMYAGMLGGNILLKEENDGTINYLLSKPISRNKILKSKIISGFLLISLFITSLTILNYVGFELSGDYNRSIFFLLSLGSFLIMGVIFSICLLVSTFFRKNKLITSLTIGFVFFSYIVQMMGGLSDKFSWIANFSVFEIANGRYIIENISLNPISVIIALLLIVVSLGYAAVRYNKKEFY